MRIRYGLRNFAAVLLMQWLLLASGLFAIFTSDRGSEGFLWLIPIGIIVPPLFTVYLYHIWFVDIEENACMRFTGPLKRKTPVLCPGDISEIIIGKKDGKEYLISIEDRDSGKYPFKRLFDGKDCEKIWEVLSNHIEKRYVTIKKE